MLRSFLGLSSPYLVREEFTKHKKEFIRNMLHFHKMERPELESSY